MLKPDFYSLTYVFMWFIWLSSVPYSVFLLYWSVVVSIYMLGFSCTKQS